MIKPPMQIGGFTYSIIFLKLSLAIYSFFSFSRAIFEYLHPQKSWR